MRMLLLGYYGVRNLGDEMMLFCLREWLGRQGIQFTVVTEYPQEVERTWGLPVVQNTPLLGERSWWDSWFRGKAVGLIRALRAHDGLIVGGGDLIRQDHGWRTFLYTLEKIAAAHLLGKPVYLVNIGIGRPRNWAGWRLLGWALRRCRRIIVRDERSLAICRKVGAIAEFAPDIVLWLPCLLGQTAVQERRYAIVSLLGHANLFGLFDLSEDRLRTLAAGLDHLVERHDLDIVFLPFQSSDDADDAAIHRQVAALMRHPERAVLRPWSCDVPELARCFAGATLTIAMRLHAAVLAAAYGRPCLSLPYDHKVREFAAYMKLNNLVAAEMLDRPEALFTLLDETVAAPAAPPGSLVGARWDKLALAPGTSQ